MAEPLGTALSVLLFVTGLWVLAAAFGVPLEEAPAIALDALATPDEPLILVAETTTGGSLTWNTRLAWWVLTPRRIIRVRAVGDVFSFRHWYAPAAETYVSLADVSGVRLVSVSAGRLLLKTQRGDLHLNLETRTVGQQWATTIQRLIDDRASVDRETAVPGASAP